MTITNIEKQKKNARRYSVYINDAFAFGLDEMDVLSLGLSVGMEMTEAEYNQVLNEVVLSDAKKKALRFLSFQSRTEKEVYGKLQDTYPEEVIEKTICFLKEYKFLDDEEYIRLYIEEKVSIRRYSPQKIRFELMKKGLDAKLVEEQFQCTDMKVLENIMYFLDRENYDQNDKKKAEKVKAKLMRKGFDYGDIKEAAYEWAQQEKR